LVAGEGGGGAEPARAGTTGVVDDVEGSEPGNVEEEDEASEEDVVVEGPEEGAGVAGTEGLAGFALVLFGGGSVVFGKGGIGCSLLVSYPLWLFFFGGGTGCEEEDDDEEEGR